MKILSYIYLAVVAKIHFSSQVNDDIKQSFRDLGIIMLQKKRLNTDITELGNLELGNFPMPNNGKVEHFYGFMNKANDILGTNFKPMTMWNVLCVALQNDTLIQNQLIHCKDDLISDAVDILNYDLNKMPDLKNISNLLYL